MAVGFTTKERESITEALLRAAGRHAALSGMKKTSVDELCAEAGISKGAFYSFYPSKEHLFLTVMERWQEEISRQAEAALRQAGKLNGPQRAALMMKTALPGHAKEIHGTIPAGRHPPDSAQAAPGGPAKPYPDGGSVCPWDFAENGGAALHCRKCGICMICMLFHTLLCEERIGPDFDEALERLIDCACQQIVQP